MSDNSSSNKRIAKNSILLSIRLIIVLLISLYSTRALLESLGVVDYGVYNVVCGFVSMFTFLNTSMSNGIQRFFNFEFGQNGIEGANRIYNMAIIIQLLLSIVIIVFTESLGLWYLNNKMVIPEDRFFAAQWIFQFSIFSMLFVIMQAPYTAAVMAHEKMDFYAIISVLDAVLRLAIVIALPVFHGDLLIIYALLFALISVINFLLYIYYCKTHFEEIYFRRYTEKKLFISMLSFSGWNIFGSFANMMKEQGLNLVLNLFFGPIVNAARGVAVQVNSAIQNFVTNLSVAIRPQVVQSYAQGDIQRTMKLTYSMSKLSCIFLYTMALPILFEIDYVLKLWLKNNVPEHTSTFVFIIVLTSFINNLNSAVSNVVHASGRMKKYQLTGSFCILMCIPFAYFVLRLDAGPEWALIMGLLSMAVAQLVALAVLKTIVRYSVRDYIKEVLIPFIYVVITSVWIPLAIHEFMEPSFIRLLIVVFASILTSSIAIYILGLNKSEKILINNMILSKNHKK